MGRTGKLFAYQRIGVAPDIMALAKGIGGGFPLGAFLDDARGRQGHDAGTHGTTYGGNPLATSVGNARARYRAAPTAFSTMSRQIGACLQARASSNCSDAIPM